MKDRGSNNGTGNEKRIRLVTQAYPFVKRMFKAEAKHRKISISKLIEEIAVIYCKSPNAAKILFEHGEQDSFIRAFKEAEAKIKHAQNADGDQHDGHHIRK